MSTTQMPVGHQSNDTPSRRYAVNRVTSRHRGSRRLTGIVSTTSESHRTLRAERIYEVQKRVFDIVASAVMISLLLPIFAGVALLTSFTSPGPILFRQRRLGRNGELFWCLKFRTMVVDAEERLRRSAALQSEFQNVFKIKDDPRITPLGRVLRKTSLDELPQLFNVLSGEMSLIGPRPIVPHELEKYGPYGAKLLTVKPGLGGAWQVSGRNDVSYSERVALDMQYIDTRSLRRDLVLVAGTAATVLRRQGAY